MNVQQLFHSTELFIDIGRDVLNAVSGRETLQIPLERAADGRLSEACKAFVADRLRSFIDRKAWQPQAKAFCAIGARGVSLRVLNLPPATREELHRLLPLQIENEFPLPPDQLAWGFQVLTRPKPAGSNGTQEILVAAVKKELLEDYSTLLAECGADAVFTLGPLARSYICPQPPGRYSVLHLENGCSELITIEGGVPIAVRMLACGRDNLLETIAGQGNGRLEPVSVAAPATPASFSGTVPAAREQTDTGLSRLTRLINGQSLGRRVYVLGLEEQSRLQFPGALAAALGNGTECEAVQLPADQPGSAAIQGVRRALERDPARLPLVLQLKQAKAGVRLSREAPLKLAAVAVGLALLSLLIPCGEALVLKSHLARKLAATQTDQGRLIIMDHELDFLRYLKENEPPYLDALLVLAKAAPPGTRLDSVSMNRRGEVSVRGSLRDGQQVADLRSKLVGSGFFSAVSVEEQAPTPDRQKVNIRMSAQWKAVGSRPVPSLESTGRSPDRSLPAGPQPPGLPGAVEPPAPAAGPAMRNIPR